MGWGHGYNEDGREIGYTVEAICDQDSCETKIDRGLSYVCGGMHDGGKHGCGQYFCWNHLYSFGSLCKICLNKMPVCSICEEPGYIEDDFCDNCGANSEEKE